jgi:hypothetical protein
MALTNRPLLSYFWEPLCNAGRHPYRSLSAEYVGHVATTAGAPSNARPHRSAYAPIAVEKAATIFAEKVSHRFDNHILGHGQCFSGHALGAAAALASIDVLHDEGLLARCRGT